MIYVQLIFYIKKHLKKRFIKNKSLLQKICRLSFYLKKNEKKSQQKIKSCVEKK